MLFIHNKANVYIYNDALLGSNMLQCKNQGLVIHFQSHTRGALTHI